MTHSDPVADLLTRIRNAGLRLHGSVEIPWFGLGEEIVRLLSDEGWILGFEVVGEGISRRLAVELKYSAEEGRRVPLIREIRRISKPSRRVYRKKSEILPLHAGLGTRIISTSQGVLPDRLAVSKGLGGEVLAEVL